MEMHKPSLPEWDGRKPDGTLHPVYVESIKLEWRAARDQLARAAEAGRKAQQVWDQALEREMETHRKLRLVLEEIGEEMPDAKP